MQVYIVTGSNVGVGKEVARILYSKNARVYVAARSEEKATAAIEDIKQVTAESKGQLIFLRLDLADLSTIKASAAQFTDREPRLHALFNNAGVMQPPQGSKTAQGYELQLGVNNIGTFMFTKLLTPTLVATAKVEGPGSSRVIWVASLAAEASPKYGVPMDNLDYHEERTSQVKYTVSKAGNLLHGTEFARRFRSDGVVSVSLNPGNLDSELWRTQPTLVRSFLRTFILHPAVYGAYTELYAAFAPELTIDKTGSWGTCRLLPVRPLCGVSESSSNRFAVVPWGRIASPRQDLIEASKPKPEGGVGVAKAFWDWTEEQIKPFL